MVDDGVKLAFGRKARSNRNRVPNGVPIRDGRKFGLSGVQDVDMIHHPSNCQNFQLLAFPV